MTSGSFPAIDVLIIVFLWCGSLIIVNPIGNFPLSDDWSFGIAVKNWIEGRGFRPTGWTSMPLITNVLWGSLFCFPAGFSFTALRLSTLTLSLLGILGTYGLIIKLCQPRWVAVIAALTLGFNPIYYALSNTFMTDVPYAAITIFAAFFLVRHLRSDSTLDLLVGTTLAIAATLSRQLGISIPIAFAVSLILKRGYTSRTMLRACIPPALCIGALLVFQHWLFASGRLPARFHFHNENLLQLLVKPKILILFFARNTDLGLLYLGWFLLPVLIVAIAFILRTHRKQTIILFISSIVTLVVGNGIFSLCNRRGLIMPLQGNVIDKSGIGPFMLRDACILHLNQLPGLPTGFWVTITVISLLGAAFLSTVICVSAIKLAPRLRQRKITDNEAASIFFLLIALVYLLPLLAGGFFDRYLFPAIPFLAAGITGTFSHFSQFPRAYTRGYRSAAVAFLFAGSLFSICSTRDYLEWNRVRWKALQDLIENTHARAEDIDGGFEFNGLYLYDPQYHDDPQKSWWWVRGDTYQIGSGSIPGYTVIKEYNYLHWMPPHVGKVVVLQKNHQTALKKSDDEHAE